MATASCCWCFWGMLMLFSIHLGLSISKPDVYIIYIGQSQMQDSDLASESHKKLLLNVFDSEEEVESSMVYSYTYGFSGFAAKLTKTQANKLADMEEVISVSKSEVMKVHTTRSWDFMGLPLGSMANNHKSTTPHLSFGDEVIVGVFDSGIWPESKSFHEEAGMRPIPPSWKGECVEGEMFSSMACNRKLIGARYYFEGFEAAYKPVNKTGEYKSARDVVGHGTHTASTAVGLIVHNASFYGFGQGAARGGAPKARLAVYKTCWKLGDDAKCTDADVLAAFCDAMKDGVDIISASFGQTPPLSPWFLRNTDIGSFHAMQLGVTVVFSAGNPEAPQPSSVSNVSPWTISVAASTMDRSFPTQIVVDDKLTFVGEGFVSKEIEAHVSNSSTYFNGSTCAEWTIKYPNTSAAGNVVLCFSSQGLVDVETATEAVEYINGSGLIFVDALSKQIPEPYVFPTVYLDMIQGTKLLHYIRSATCPPVVKILPSKTVIGKSTAPSVAYFSGRGPNSIAPDILKPDVSAPGVDILAAWPPKTPPTILSDDTRSVDWNFQSGTSMSCPHVTGVAALIKAAHPNWSPAAIRSALMTTAYTRDTTYDDIQVGGWMRASDPFDVGAGHINPLKAFDPGLIYDMKPSDYVVFLCSMGYTQKQINKIVLPLPGTKTICPKTYTSISNMNYPSIAVSNLQYTTTIKRAVRNVGSSKHVVYFPQVISPNGVDVTIWPKVLFFSWLKDEITYYVTLRPRKKSQGRYDFGEIVWTDGYHNVRSPLVVCVNNIDGHDRNKSVSYSTYSRTKIPLSS